MIEIMLLVADDDDAIRESLRLAIEDEGFKVCTAADGLEALEIMISDPPCAVLLDLMMPKMTGWQVFDRMKADPVLATVPVCIITAAPEHLPKDAVAILKKPVVLDDVINFVVRHC
jgi:CheY-like chemotaxis protein